MKQDFFKRSLSYFLIFSLIVNPVLAAQPLKSGAGQQPQKMAAAESPAIVAEQKSADLKLDASVKAAQATIKTASNGTQVVDIATPSVAGISHNLFAEFNVGSQGLIFNNSATPVLTQLGGWSDGNRRLAGGSASIILNEVTGLGGSNLLGQIEIAGQSAEFILANPNGISCNGCGFINTPRVSMITGRVKNGSSGELGFDIGSGSFRLDGAGLNAANLDSFDIVTRAAQFNAQLYAQKLNLYTGVNHYGYATGKLTSVAAPGVAEASGIALDVSSLGGMYANSIRLIGTEKGMGVNSQGLIQSVNDLELTADGNIKVKDVIANQSAKIQANNLEVKGNLYAKDLQVNAAEEIHNYGLIAAEDSLALSAKKLSQQGELYSGLKSDFTLANSGNLTLAMSDSITNNGTIRAAADAKIVTKSFDNDKGNLVFTAEGKLDGLEQLHNSGLIQFNSDNSAISAAHITNSGTIALAGTGQLSLNAVSELNNVGNINASNLLQITSDKLSNIKGKLAAATIQIEARASDNAQGQISANQIGIVGDTLSNSEGHISAYASTNDALVLHLKSSLNNDQGSIATNALNLKLASESISNQAGLLSLGESARLDIVTLGKLNNRDGRIEAGDLSVQAGDLDNSNAAIAAKHANLQVQDIENNLGLIQGDFLTIFAQSYRSQGGILLAASATGDALELNLANDFENAAGAIVEAHSGDLLINAHKIDNQGGTLTLLGTGRLQLSAGTVINQQGKIGAESALMVKADALENSSGDIVSNELELNVGATNNQGGNISADNFSLKGSSLDNSQGRVDVQVTLTVSLAQLLNSGGVFLSGGSGDISAEKIDNKSGQLLNSGKGLLLIKGSHLDNNNGAIQTNADLSLQLQDLSNHQGEIAAQASLQLQGKNLDNTSGTISGENLDVNGLNVSNVGGLLAAQTGLQLTSAQTLNNNSGQLLAGNKITLQAPQIDNTQGIIKTADLSILTNALTNQQGYLQGDQIALQIPELNNHEGTIFATATSGAGLQLQVDRTLDNSGGIIANKGSQFALIAGEINNVSGNINYQGSGSFTLQTGRLDNRQGSLLSNSNLNISASALDNSGGTINGGNDLGLWVQGDLLNILGQIIASNTQQVHATYLNNRSGALNASNLVVVADRIDNTGAGRLEAETLNLGAMQLNNEGLILANSRATNGLLFNVSNFNNAGRLESYGQDLLLQGVNLHSDGGEIVHHGDGALHIVSDGVFDNQQGLISTQGTLVIDALEINNQAGKLLAGKKLNIQLDSLNNRGGLLQSGDGFSLRLENFDNSQGGSLILGGTSDATISVAHLFDNNTGSISYWGTNTLRLSADNFSNANGFVGGDGAIELSASTLNNAAGYLGSGSGLSLMTRSLDNSAGEINAAELSLVLGQFENTGLISSSSQRDNSFQLTAEHFSNKGILQFSANNLVLAAAHLDNTEGTIIHSGSGVLQIAQDQFSNQRGLINSSGSLLFNVNELDNSNQGELVAAQQLRVNGESLNNTAGVIQAEHGVTLAVADINNGTQGQILALGDDLQIQSHRLFNAGQIAVNQLLAINAADIENHGLLQAGDLLRLTATNLSNQGEIRAKQIEAQLDQLQNTTDAVLYSGKLELTAAHVINQGLMFAGDEQQTSKLQIAQFDNSGKLESHNNELQIIATNVVNDTGSLLYQGAGSLKLDAQRLLNHQGFISANSANLNLMQFDNGEGTLVSDSLVLSSTQLNNQAGLVQANQSLKLTADDFDNQQGVLLAQGDRLNEINAHNLLNNQGKMLLSMAHINAGNLGNNGGEVVADDLAVTADNFNNQNGVLVSANKHSALQLVIANTLTNLNGLIQGDRLTTEISAGLLDNSGGQVLHFGSGQLVLRAQELRNLEAGEISTAAGLDVQVAESFLNAGQLAAAGNASLIAQTIHNTGSLISNQQFAIQANHLSNEGSADSVALISADWLQLSIATTANGEHGRIEANQLQINGDSLVNQGLLISSAQDNQSLDLQLSSVRNSGLIVTAAENISLSNLDNSGGQLLHKGEGSFTIAGDSMNNTTGVIESNGQIALQALSVDNSQGSINSTSASGIVANGTTLNNFQGLITAESTLLNYAAINNRDGNMESDSLTLSAQQITNEGGHIVASQLDVAADDFSNSNSTMRTGLLSVDQLRMSVVNLNNHARIQGGTLSLRGSQLNNNDGLLLALDDQLAEALHLDFLQGISNNRGVIESHGHNLLLQSSLDNRDGNLVLTGSGLLQLQSLNNDQGFLHSNGDIELATPQSLPLISNREGQILALNNISVVTGDLDNNLGTVAAGNQLRVQADNVDNSAGLLIAKGTTDQSLDLQVQTALINNQGIIETLAENFSLNLTSLRNENGEVRHQGSGSFSLVTEGNAALASGLLATRGNLIATIDGRFDNHGTLIAANNVAVAATELHNHSGALIEAQRLGITADHVINAGGIEAEQLSVATNTIDNRGGYLRALGEADNSLSLAVNALDNGDGGVVESRANNLSLNMRISNTGGSILHWGLGNLSIAELLNSDGQVFTAGDLRLNQQLLDNAGGLLQANHNLHLQVAEFNNQSGQVFAGEQLQAQLTTLNNAQGGSINGRNGFALQVVGTLNNEAGELVTQAQDMSVNSGELHNAGGLILHEGDGGLNLVAGDNLYNSGGKILSNGELNINVSHIFNNSLDDASALLRANRLTLVADQLDNNGGRIQADDQLSMTLPSIHNQGGQIVVLGSADDSLQINAAELDNQSGEIEVHSQNYAFGSFGFNNDNGVFTHWGSGTFSIFNQGVLHNRGGLLQTAGDADINVTVIDNSGGSLLAHHLQLNAAQNIDNRDGTLAAEILSLTGNTIDNRQGLIASTGQSAQALTFDTPNTIDNRQGVIRNSATNWALDVERINNTGGALIHQGSGVFTLNSQGILSNSGTISSTQDLQLNVAGLNNLGNLIADNQLIINSQSTVSNGANALIKGGQSLSLRTSGDIANAGEISARYGFNLDAGGDLINYGKIATDAQAASLRASTVSNSGLIAHNGSGNFSVNSYRLNNSGSLLSLGALGLSASVIDNTALMNAATVSAQGFSAFTNAGELVAESIQLNGDSLINQGHLLASGANDSFTAVVNHLLNSGNLVTNSTNQRFYGDFTNSGEFTHAGQGVLLLGNAGAVNTAGGTISTAGVANLSGGLQGNGDLFANRGIVIGGTTIFENNGGSFYTRGDITATTGINNSGSLISDGKFSITTAQAINNTGLLQGGEIDWSVGNLVNQSGKIVATGTASSGITATLIDNSYQGLIYANSLMFALVASQGSINNTQGVIQKNNSNGLLILNTAVDLSNNAGNIYADSAMNLIARQGVDNSYGTLTAANLTTTLRSLNNNDGKIQLTGSNNSDPHHQLRTVN